MVIPDLTIVLRFLYEGRGAVLPPVYSSNGALLLPYAPKSRHVAGHCKILGVHIWLLSRVALLTIAKGWVYTFAS
jgi:hypothetical protein